MVPEDTIVCKKCIPASRQQSVVHPERRHSFTEKQIWQFHAVAAVSRPDHPYFSVTA